MAARWTDRILANAEADGTGAAVSAGAAGAGAVLPRSGNVDTPLTVGPDSALWRGSSDDPRIQQLAKELVAVQIQAQTRMTDAMMSLLTAQDLRTATSQPQRPARIIGRLTQPGGAAAGGLRVSLDASTLNAAEAAQAGATTASDGSFAIQLPPRLRDAGAPLSDLVVQGANGIATLAGALAGLPSAGVLPTLTLDDALAPLPLDFLGMLAQLDADGSQPDDTSHALPTVSLGEDACTLMFRKDA
jgi:hypothetical protein